MVKCDVSDCNESSYESKYDYRLSETFSFCKNHYQEIVK